jgi:hypothetical protein
MLKFLINYYEVGWFPYLFEKCFDGKVSVSNLHYIMFGCDVL